MEGRKRGGGKKRARDETQRDRQAGGGRRLISATFCKRPSFRTACRSDRGRLGKDV
jgi:hypothetical protein